MKIAMFAGSLTRGGTERVVVTLAENFIKRGHEVLVVTPIKAENEYEISPSIKRIISDLTPDEMGGRIGNIFKRWKKLENIWRTEKTDVILSFIGRNNFSALISARRVDIPVAVAVRADPKMEYCSAKDRIMMKLLYPKAAAVILQTHDSEAFFPNNVRKLSVILKNPINPAFFEDYSDNATDGSTDTAGSATDGTTGGNGNSTDTAAGPHRIVSVGRIDENKNHRMLINAFNSIKDDIPEYSLEIIGEGELRNELKALVKSLDIEDRVSLSGSCDNVAKKIYGADLFVLCSDTEGVPNTLLEAMALGIPAISTDCPCGGPKDIIVPGKNGFLVPVGDAQSLADCMYKVLGDEELRKSISLSAKKTASEFSEDKVVEEWLALAEKLHLRKNLKGNK